MAKRSKKKNSASAGGFLFGIILIGVLAVTAIALLKNSESEDPVPDGSDVVHNTQTASSTETGTDETDQKTTDQISSATQSSSDSKTDKVTDTDSATSSSKNTGTSSTPPTDNTREEYVSKNDTASFAKDQWYMLLANPDNPVPEGYTFEQAKIKSAGRDWIVDARCAEDLKAMIAAAKADGVSLILCSAYRTIERQTTNFNNKMQEYINKGKTEEEARAITATIIAVPGTSEHHTGMAVDIVTPSYQSLNAGFDKTAAYKWLEANCAEFGFVLRYREDKQHITKIIYEPWHYRYVGKQAATIMMEEKISFEEFLDKYGA
ncbi:MAG: M15 family metallopeptidase [Clostridia bacterium]|nr:M15 family metallopeptidase [Clostridia bacterium]